MQTPKKLEPAEPIYEDDPFPDEAIGLCTYDANGNMLTCPKTVNGVTKTWTFTYDANGNMLTRTTWV